MTLPHHLRRFRGDAAVPPPPNPDAGQASDAAPLGPCRTEHVLRLEAEVARREAEGTLVPASGAAVPCAYAGCPHDGTVPLRWKRVNGGLRADGKGEAKKRRCTPPWTGESFCDLHAAEERQKLRAAGFKVRLARRGGARTGSGPRRRLRDE